MQAPTVTIEAGAERTVAALAGSMVIAHVDALRRALAPVGERRGSVEIDLSGVDVLDTSGAWLVVELRRHLKAAGAEVSLAGVTEPQSGLIETVEASLPDHGLPDRPRRSLKDWLADVGAATALTAATIRDMLGLLGMVLACIAGLVLRPWRLRLTSLVFHMQASGLNAVPIVALMAFLIGIVLAFQGAAELRQFGAEIFVVDLISISLLRELGVLLTAIIVAGRSASAFTASIGAMKMREEIDAMRTLGLDPISVLVVPRVLALILMLPVLAFIADLSGLIGGALMSWVELGVSPGVFQARLVDETDVRHFVVGMVKAPFFAALIGLIGCYQGLKVEGDTESLGRLTSDSVVMAIFAVIVADAMFSIFFSIIDY